MKNQKTAFNIFLSGLILMMICSGNAIEQANSTVKIGTQNWMKNNLNVSTYKNGDAIPQVQDSTVWANLTTGAWCYFGNKKENSTKYGKLYNWYAVNDPRGLAPVGFHIPNDAEWTKLIDYLGGTYEAGVKMKSKIGWEKEGNGTNTSGFEGVPGGSRGKDGAFKYMGISGTYWSSSGGSDYGARYHSLSCYTDNTAIGIDDSKSGFSVRCLAD